MRKHQQAAGEDDRHHAGLVDAQRQVLPIAAEHAPAADVLGALRRDAPLALRDEDDAGDDADEQQHRARACPPSPCLPPPPPSSLDDWFLKKLPTSTAGMRARMPAMISRLMPLPMPNSSICSPSHIRKIVPAVIVMTR